MMATAPEQDFAAASGMRKRVLIRGILFAPDGAHDVWIRDISTEGALVTSKDRLPGNCDVILKRGSIFAAARVAAFTDTGTEVKFYRSLTDDAVALASQPHQD